MAPPIQRPHVCQFTIGRTWSYPGKYGNARLDLVVSVPPGADLENALTIATRALDDMNPTDLEQSSSEILAQIEEWKAKTIETIRDEGYISDLPEADCERKRARAIEQLREKLTEAQVIEARIECARESLAQLSLACPVRAA